VQRPRTMFIIKYLGVLILVFQTSSCLMAGFGISNVAFSALATNEIAKLSCELLKLRPHVTTCHIWLMFWKCRVRISAGIQTVLTEAFRGFSHSPRKIL
jgi:hypothetical protein